MYCTRSVTVRRTLLWTQDSHDYLSQGLRDVFGIGHNTPVTVLRTFQQVPVSIGRVILSFSHPLLNGLHIGMHHPNPVHIPLHNLVTPHVPERSEVLAERRAAVARLSIVDVGLIHIDEVEEPVFHGQVHRDSLLAGNGFERADGIVERDQVASDFEILA